MRTRSQARKRRQQQVQQTSVESSNLEKPDNPPIGMPASWVFTMAQLVTIQGPKAVNHDTEVTKDTMPPANNGSTEDVQPP
ncbi:hypothetical protein Tco_1280314 [Tanacetum coccineum]